jgi:predicted phosphodiesterase
MLRIIGDVHGKIGEYLALARESDMSLQVGDLGFNYKMLHDLPVDSHKVVAGNHDNYSVEDGRFFMQTAHFLGDFGIHNFAGIGDIFFVRGGRSIDRDQRTPMVDWWPEEELSADKRHEALLEYIRVKPDIVVTHECPASIIGHVSRISSWNGSPIEPSDTSRLLDSMMELHSPRLWFFGHFHKSWRCKLLGTEFICLDELESLDLS